MDWRIPKQVKKTGKTALIDGDVVLYRIGFACQKTVYTVTYQGDTQEVTGKRALQEFLYKEKLPPDSEDVEITEREEVEPLANALHSIKLLLNQTLDRTETDNYKIFISGEEDTFRDKLAQYVKYKGNRGNTKPALYYDMITYLVDVHGAEIVEGIEADDALTLAHDPETTVICSIDKDLKQVPGYHYSFIHDTMEYVSPEEADRNFWRQMITGDAVDNIIGIHRMGVKRADKALHGCRSFFDMFDVVWDLYQEKIDGDPMDRFLENMQLLWLLRDESEVQMKVKYETDKG